MSSVVFVICVPSEEKENHLHSIQTKRMQIVENGKKCCSKTKYESPNPNIGGCQGNEEISTRIPMLYVLEEILESFDITNAVWCRGKGDYVQVTFPLDSQEQCETLLYILGINYIGKLYESSVSVLPCSIHYNGHSVESQSETSENGEGESQTHDNAWNELAKSKKTRLTVDQIVETVRQKASFTFNFVCLILISTTMCALGLVENSTVYLLSSMVMSPMMGPVMAATFGSVIRDKQLIKTGVQTGLLGLGMAMLVGFCYGSIICILTDKYGDQEWPTYEITSRGEFRSLWIGCIIALLSGAAVAIGILSDNIASLVGVAISTSLMPPSVNAGIIWSMAVVYYLKGNSSSRYHSLNYQRHYSNNDIVELTTLGAMSLCLTIINILCIYFAAVCIFKVKEVAPMGSMDNDRKRFWKHGIKTARYNNTIQREEGEKLRDDYKHLRDIIVGSRTFHPGDRLYNSDPNKTNRKSYKRAVHQSTWTQGVSARRIFCHTDDCSFKEKSEKVDEKLRYLSGLFECQVQKTPENIDNEEESIDSNRNSNAEAVFTSSKRTFVVTPCSGEPYLSPF